MKELLNGKKFKMAAMGIMGMIAVFFLREKTGLSDEMAMQIAGAITILVGVLMGAHAAVDCSTNFMAANSFDPGKTDGGLLGSAKVKTGLLGLGAIFVTMLLKDKLGMSEEQAGEVSQKILLIAGMFLGASGLTNASANAMLGARSEVDKQTEDPT